MNVSRTTSEAWKTIRIGDTGQYINGHGFKESDWHDDGLPIIRIQNLTNPDKTFNRTNKAVASELLVSNTDILVSWSATLDVYRWNRGPAVLNQHIFRVVPNCEVVDPSFLYYLLKEVITELRNSTHVHGSTMKHINRGPFLAHEVTIPESIDEQKQIVAEIETQFARLDDAVAALKRVQARLKRYRASVLKAACEGRLVPTEAELARQEGRGYESASVLLERIKADRAASGVGKRGKVKDVSPLDPSSLPELPEGWVWTVLGQLIAEPLSNGRSVADSDDGVPVLRLNALRDGWVDLSQRKLGDWTDKEAAPFMVARDDFLVARGNGSIRLVGRGARVKQSPDKVAYPDTLIRVRPNYQIVELGYLDLAWRTPSVRNQIESVARTTAGIYKINQRDLSSITIPIPPIAEQARIVPEGERLLSIADRQGLIIDANLKRAESLRQSILRKAFNGELT